MKRRKERKEDPAQKLRRKEHNELEDEKYFKLFYER